MANEQQLLDVLSEFARTMVTDFPTQAILDHLVERIVEIMPITAAGVTLISPGVRPRYIAASNDAALRFEELQTELGEGPCLAAYRTGEAVAVPDLRADERFPNFGPRALEAGLAAVFTFPLHHGDHRLGALDLYRDTAGGLSPQAMSWAQTLADVTAAYLLISQARAALQESSAQARHAALHDALTGLPNRVLMVERLEHAFARVHGSRKIVAVFFIDLDRFKAVNDRYGHQVGDEVLVAVAGRLMGVLRSDDTLGRLYGDEFVVLCEDLSGSAHAEAIVARVHAALATPCLVSGIEIDVAASVGIAFAGHDPVNPEQLLHAADIAMYRAKHAAGSPSPIIDLRDEVRKSIRRELTDGPPVGGNRRPGGSDV